MVTMSLPAFSGREATWMAAQTFAPVLMISATSGEGLDQLDAEISNHIAHLSAGDELARKRAEQEAQWIAEGIRANFGSEGVRASREIKVPKGGPFTRERMLGRELRCRLFLLTRK